MVFHLKDIAFEADFRLQTGQHLMGDRPHIHKRLAGQDKIRERGLQGPSIRRLNDTGAASALPNGMQNAEADPALSEGGKRDSFHRKPQPALRRTCNDTAPDKVDVSLLTSHLKVICNPPDSVATCRSVICGRIVVQF